MEKAKSIKINAIDSFDNKAGVKLWRDFTWILDPNECEMMDIDNERNITFLRLIANKQKS